MQVSFPIESGTGRSALGSRVLLFLCWILSLSCFLGLFPCESARVLARVSSPSSADSEKTAEITRQIAPVVPAKIGQLPYFVCQSNSEEDLDQMWWMPKHFNSKASPPNTQNRTPEKAKAEPEASDRNRLFDQTSQPSAASMVNSDSSNQASGSEEEPFVVPNWFATQPQPYTRPTEIFRYPYNSDVGPRWCGNGSWWPSFGWGSRLPSLGWGGWRVGLGWGGWHSRLGWGGWSPSVGWGGWRVGLGWGGWHSGLGWGGWSGWGYGLPGCGSGLGSLRSTGTFSTRVIQTEPSKASGNYYAPSTVDTTASGSYYASGTPALVPAMRIKKSPDSYWDEKSNPVPKNLR